MKQKTKKTPMSVEKTEEIKKITLEYTLDEVQILYNYLNDLAQCVGLTKGAVYLNNIAAFASGITEKASK